MIHEVVHTNLALVKIKSPYASQVGEYSPEDFARLLDAHFESDGEEHEFIAQHYVPIISNALEEILPLLESQDRINYIGALELYYGAENLGSWNWQDFFDFSSWGGLESTDLFKTEILGDPLTKKIYDWYKSRSIVQDGNTSHNQFTINRS